MTLWRTVCVSVATALLTISMVFPTIAGDSGQISLKGDTLEKVLKSKTLKVGFSLFEPWAMKDKNGQYVGFEIDVAKRLASDMGVQVKFVPTEWKNIIPALIDHKFDIIICGMNMTPERILKVHFSDPYEFNSMSIVANKNVATEKRTRADYNNARLGGLSNLGALSDFNNPNVRIGIRMGTTAEDAVKKHMPKAKVKTFTDEKASIEALLNGEISCLMASQPLPRIIAEKYPDKLYLPLKNGFACEPGGFVVRKGDHNFLIFLNSWIKICNSDGWLQKRYQHWFKTTLGRCR